MFGELPSVIGIANHWLMDTKMTTVTMTPTFMERAHETGLCFNADKCKIRCTEILFFGHIIGSNGLRSNPRKTESIVNMDPSTSLGDLQTFLGMTQFFSRFLPNLASLAANLWNLTKQSSEFQWAPEHQSAVDNIKKAVTSPSSLQYFDSIKSVTTEVDASQCGLGAALLLDKGPIEYRSKLLMETETCCSNIEREMLAVVHGFEKFHHYTYGGHVTVMTDHKPPESIFKMHHHALQE